MTNENDLARAYDLLYTVDDLFSLETTAMNIKEFAALKVGDKIENPADGGASVGEIVETTDRGVRVVWGPRHAHETRFFYSVVGTAWFQWSKVQQPPPAGTPCRFTPCNYPTCGCTESGHVEPSVA